jgi:hypothetical protein
MPSLIHGVIVPRGLTYWLTYKDDSGKWRSKSTGYRANNFGEKKQAELLCRKATKEEQAARDISVAGDQFEDWVPRWLKERYEGRKGTTYDRYSRSWRVLERYFQSLGIKTPAQVTFNVVEGYLSWRPQNNGKKNTAIDGYSPATAVIPSTEATIRAAMVVLMFICILL